MTSVYDFEAQTITGQSVTLSEHRGKVILIVNTASKCGFTPQFEGLEKLWQARKDQGLVILGFPCNQFGSQDPGSDGDIASFCQLNYGVSFPMMSKIDVNGGGAHPLYQWLVKRPVHGRCPRPGPWGCPWGRSAPAPGRRGQSGTW